MRKAVIILIVINSFKQSNRRNWSWESCNQSSSQLSVEKIALKILTNVGQECPWMTHQLLHQQRVNISMVTPTWHLTLGFHLLLTNQPLKICEFVDLPPSQFNVKKQVSFHHVDWCKNGIFLSLDFSFNQSCPTCLYLIKYIIFISVIQQKQLINQFTYSPIQSNLVKICLLSSISMWSCLEIKTNSTRSRWTTQNLVAFNLLEFPFLWISRFYGL